MRIALVDSHPAKGHRRAYTEAIINQMRAERHIPVMVGPTSWCDGFARDDVERIEVPVFQGSGTYWSRVNIYQRFIAEVQVVCIQNSITHVHLLSIDGQLHSCSRLNLSTSGLVWTATLHWYPFLAMNWNPKRWVKGLASLFWCRKMGKEGVHWMVHSSSAAMILSRTGCGRVTEIDYPNFDVLPGVGGDPSAVRRRLGMVDGDRLFLCFGGTRHDKGVDLAIRALAQCPRSCHLLVAGEAQYFSREKLLELATEMGVADRVHLELKFVPDQELPNIFAAADVVLIPYRQYFTGQSGPLIVGASLGRPIIASNVPVVASTLRAYEFGRLIPAENVDALARAMANENLPSVAKGERLLKLLRRTSPEDFAKRVTQVYQSATEPMT